MTMYQKLKVLLHVVHRIAKLKHQRKLNKGTRLRDLESIAESMDGECSVVV